MNVVRPSVRPPLSVLHSIGQAKRLSPPPPTHKLSPIIFRSSLAHSLASAAPAAFLSDIFKQITVSLLPGVLFPLCRFSCPPLILLLHPPPSLVLYYDLPLAFFLHILLPPL